MAAGNAGMIIRPETYTLADVFKNSGYITGAIGKWHLGLGDKSGMQDWNAPLPTALGDLGFDYSYIMAATADRVPCVFIENGKVAAKYKKKGWFLYLSIKSIACAVMESAIFSSFHNALPPPFMYPMRRQLAERNPRFANFRRLSITNRLVCINGCSNQRKITKRKCAR